LRSRPILTQCKDGLKIGTLVYLMCKKSRMDGYNTLTEILDP